MVVCSDFSAGCIERMIPKSGARSAGPPVPITATHPISNHSSATKPSM